MASRKNSRLIFLVDVDFISNFAVEIGRSLGREPRFAPNIYKESITSKTG